MSKELEELMQKRIISEDTQLSKYIEDIVPKIEKKFTDLELEANKKEQFSLVVYKNENPIIRFFKGIKLSLEKIKIMRKTREVQYAKNQNK